MPDSELTPSSPADNGEVKTESPQTPETREAKDRAAFSKKVLDHHGKRALKVWILVMLSMGKLPTVAERGRVKEVRQLANEYSRRLGFIRDNLSSAKDIKAPQILYFKKHPSASASSPLANKFVDVVSALEGLRTKFGPLPKPVEELLSLAVDVSIPLDWNEREAVAPDSQSKEVTQPEQRKVRSSDLTRIHQNSIKLIAALVTIHYGTLEGNLQTVLQSILLDAEQSTVTLGLAEHALRTQLQHVIASQKN